MVRKCKVVQVIKFANHAADFKYPVQLGKVTWKIQKSRGLCNTCCGALLRANSEASWRVISSSYSGTPWILWEVTLLDTSSFSQSGKVH